LADGSRWPTTFETAAGRRCNENADIEHSQRHVLTCWLWMKSPPALPPQGLSINIKREIKMKRLFNVRVRIRRFR